MKKHSSDLEKVIKVWIGGIAIFTAGMLGIVLSKGIHSLKRYRRDFDADTLEEVSGNVIEAYYSKESRHDTKGVILFLDSEDELVEVHLGPSWYIDRQFRPFKAGEEVTVRGSKVEYKDQDILVAQSIERGRKKFKLRDEEGSPFWNSQIN